MSARLMSEQGFDFAAASVAAAIAAGSSLAVVGVASGSGGIAAAAAAVMGAPCAAVVLVAFTVVLLDVDVTADAASGEAAAGRRVRKNHEPAARAMRATITTPTSVLFVPFGVVATSAAWAGKAAGGGTNAPGATLIGSDGWVHAVPQCSQNA